MAKEFHPDDLTRHLDRYGDRATVVTVSSDVRPHVGTSLVVLDGDRLVLTVGSRAAENLAVNGDLCLTWTPPPGEDYQLIVDATVETVAPTEDSYLAVVRPRAGIRHRVVDAAGSGPTCLTLDQS